LEHTFKVSKYIFQDFKKALIIYYGIIIGIFMLMLFSYMRFSSGQSGDDIRFGGFGVSTVIFMFVSGLNCFKVNFKFMQANNISRKRFYRGTIIALISVAALMAFVDVVLNNVFNQIIPYEGVFEQLYRNGNYFADFVWSFALMVLAVSTGMFITLLYYKCNKLMKVMISFIPVVLFILLALFNNLTKGAVAYGVVNFFTAVLGFENYNPYIAVFSFFIASAGVLALSYGLIRRMPIKD